MINFLEFKPAKCKDCYKCLKHCPVNAIEVINHQAQIISSRCILCGNCTLICPQNAKKVHNSIDEVLDLIKQNDNVIASVAPSFVSSFNIDDFEVMREALKTIGFKDAFETAIGAYAVSREYEKLLASGKFKNFITSACPAINRMIQLYYHDALKYLAPVVSPMVAHYRIIKANNPNAKVVFIGPCIAKKREAYENNLDGCLTFEEINQIFKKENIDLKKIHINNNTKGVVNSAKYYPISRGIIKSFDNNFVKGYEYLAMDGNQKAREILDNIDKVDGIFIELNSCDNACVNGPCSLLSKGTSLNANSAIRKYVRKDIISGGTSKLEIPENIDFSYQFKPLDAHDREPSEEEIKDILARTGKYSKDDELNCGACGYDTCRKKAWAVINGYADIEMCVPYMRKKAESMSYEIIQNMPNGIIVCDDNYRIKEINSMACKLFLVSPNEAKNMFVYELMDSSAFEGALEKKKNTYHQKIDILKTHSVVDMSVIALREEHSAFAVLKDITEKQKVKNEFNKLRANTINITDEVIKKQMRVAQEIASVLGETVAETKVAILNLKKSLENEDKIDEDE